MSMFVHKVDFNNRGAYLKCKNQEAISHFLKQNNSMNLNSLENF